MHLLITTHAWTCKLLLTFPNKDLTVRTTIPRWTKAAIADEGATVETATCCNGTNRACTSQLSTTVQCSHTHQAQAGQLLMSRRHAAAYTDSVGSPFHNIFHRNPPDSSNSENSCCRNLHSDRSTHLSLSIAVSTLYDIVHSYSIVVMDPEACTDVHTFSTNSYH